MCPLPARRAGVMTLVDSAGELHYCAAKMGVRRKTQQLERRQPIVVRQARKRPIACEASAPKASWENVTERLVATSAVPFLFLFMPQLLKNARSLATNPEALGILSWLSYLTGLFGNTLLLQYFTTKRESSAILVQAIGIASSFAVLTQIRMAGFIPRAVYSAVATVVGVTATLTALKLGGRLDSSKQGQWVWSVWQKMLGLAGLAVVPQVLWGTLLPGSPTLAPCLCTLALGCAMLAAGAAGRLPPAVAEAWGALSACTATLLFVVQPIAQLARNFSDPRSLAGLSLATIQLAAAGNALMVPRALFTRDWIWLLGSAWGSLVFGWAQMLSMWLGRAPDTGARYLPTLPFLSCSMLLFAWFAGVAWADARAKRAAARAAPQ